MSHDDIDIRLQDAAPRAPVPGVPPDLDMEYSVCLSGRPGPERMRVYLHETALRRIESHAAANPEREVGGVLIGNMRTHQGKPFLLVEQIIPGLSAEGSATRLTFTHDTWSQITTIKDRDYPSSQIVGWYHTHPDLGVFMSGDDQYIHRHFFQEPWQVALVADPINRDRGIFLWQNETLVRDGGLRIYTKAADQRQLQQFVAALGTPAPETPETSPGDAPRQVTVQLNFEEAGLNLFKIMPASWRPIFGIHHVQTAPKISLKNLTIFVLLMIIFGQYLTKENVISAMVHRIWPHAASTQTKPSAKPDANSTGGNTANSATNTTLGN